MGVTNSNFSFGNFGGVTNLNFSFGNFGGVTISNFNFGNFGGVINLDFKFGNMGIRILCFVCNCLCIILSAADKNHVEKPIHYNNMQKAPLR